MIELEHLLCISGSIVAVYSAGEFCYLYEVLFWDGYLYQPQEFYLCPKIALKIAVGEVKTVMGY